MQITKESLPVSITQHEDGHPVIMLGDLDITQYVATGSLRIEYPRNDDLPWNYPQITFTLVGGPTGEGYAELDFDVALLRRLLAEHEGA